MAINLLGAPLDAGNAGTELPVGDVGKEIMKDPTMVKMPSLWEHDTPKGKAAKASMDFIYEHVFPQFNFWKGSLGNNCLYVNGMAAFEMGTGASYSYEMINWLGANIEGASKGLKPIYDTKAFTPSHQIPIEGTGFKDDFRHAMGKDWLIYGQTISIPEKFTKPDIVDITVEAGIAGAFATIGQSPSFRKYETPIDNWFVFFQENPMDISERLFKFSKKEGGKQGDKLVPGLLDIIAKRKWVFHAYYPVGLWTDGEGTANIMVGSQEFFDKNPVFNSWIMFSVWQQGLVVTPVEVSQEFMDAFPEVYGGGAAEGNIALDSILYDHYFKMQKPFNYKNIEGSFVNKPLYVKVVPHYNFTEPKYEGVISDPRVSETILPNMYVFLSETKLNNFDPSVTAGTSGSQYLEIMTLHGNLPNVFIDVLNEKGEKVGEKQNKPYFSMWTNKYLDIHKNNPTIINALSTKLSNIGVCISDIELLKDFNEKEQVFPMAMEIEFSTDQSTEFAEILHKSHLSKALMLEIMRRTTSELEGGEDSFTPTPFVHASAKQPALIGQDGKLNADFTKPYVSLNALHNEVMDLDKWIHRIGFTSYNKSVPPNALFIGVDEEDQVTSEMTQWIQFIKTKSFRKQYKDFVKSKFREDIDSTLNGKVPSYNETLLYRIEKREGSKIIQNFYLPNSSDINIMRFFDTQVKYGVDYTYKIYAYQLVVGTRYSYSNFNAPIPEQLTKEYADQTIGEIMLGAIFGASEEDMKIPWEPWWAFSHVDYEPCTKIIEVPWYEFTQTMIDHPPPPPDVNFVPYRGIKDEILINISQNNGEYLMEPVSIKIDDEKQHDMMRKALQVPKGEPILYRGDDPVIAYEIFRTTQRPKKWKDFSQKLIKTVDTIKEGSSFKDNLLPNTKYYYIIRAIDRHFHFSNPSAIYEVELVSDPTENIGGIMEISGLTAVKPRIRIVELDIVIEKSLFKPMRKYLRIAPTMEQVLLSEEESSKSAYDDKKNKLGLTNNPLFGGPEGRKFKIRLTSKKTGKKVDININFRLKYEKVDKSDLETHLPSLFDVAYSDAELVLSELKGEIVSSIMAESAKITTDYKDSQVSATKSILSEWGVDGYSAASPIVATMLDDAPTTTKKGSPSGKKPKWSPSTPKKEKPTY